MSQGDDYNDNRIPTELFILQKKLKNDVDRSE